MTSTIIGGFVSKGRSSLGRIFSSMAHPDKIRTVERIHINFEKIFFMYVSPV
jgi:hypothetical protein